MLTTLPASQHYSFDEVGASLKLIFPYRGRRWDTVGRAIGALLLWLWLIVIAVTFIVPATIEAIPIRRFYSLALTMALSFAATIPLIGTLDLLWLLIGKEAIEISDDSIIVRHQIFGLGVARKFNASKVNGLFVSRVKDGQLARWLFRNNQPGYLNFKRGKVAFNYGKTIWGGVKTFRFGTILDEEEARQIVSLIHKRFPQYTPQRQRVNANT